MNASSSSSKTHPGSILVHRAGRYGPPVQFGRIGTAGQSQRKEFKTAAEAKASYDKLIAEKVKKGYAETSGTTTTMTSAAAPGRHAQSPRPRPRWRPRSQLPIRPSPRRKSAPATVVELLSNRPLNRPRSRRLAVPQPVVGIEVDRADGRRQLDDCRGLALRRGSGEWGVGTAAATSALAAGFARAGLGGR